MTNPGDRTRVLIADDEPLIREALVALIESDASLELVGAAKDASEAIDIARTDHPDVVLLDVRMPGGGGVRAASTIRSSRPDVRIVALSAFEDRGSVLEILEAGAGGYLVKGVTAREILDAIHSAARGMGVLSEQVTGGVIEELSGHLERESVRERDLRLKAKRIRRFLDGDGIEIAAQPIVRLTDRAVVGHEALARFTLGPERTPDRWFAEAAEVGLLIELELAAIRAVADRLDVLPAYGYLSVNLSPQTAASQGFADLPSDLPTERIVLEITEHAAVEDYEALNEALTRLRARGLRLAIDDAGAGFASLRHILLLRPDIIKLDMSLTRGIDADEFRRSLARALISFAGEVGADIVAEGIETHDELDALVALGVSYGQGFYLGLPAAVLTSLRQRRRAVS